MKLKGRSQRYHESIDTLSIYAFDAINRDADKLPLLIIGEATATIEELQTAWNAILAQYLDVLSNRRSVKATNNLKAKMLAYKIEFETIKKLVELPIDENIIDAIAKCGYTIDQTKDIAPQLMSIKKRSMQLVTKFKEVLFEFEQTENKQTKKAMTLQEVAYAIERFYGNGMQIDLHKTTARKWPIIEGKYIDDVETYNLKIAKNKK